MMKRGALPGQAWGLAGLYVAILLLVFVGFGFLTWRPELASSQGEGIDGLITYLLVVTGAIVLIGHAVLFYFIVRGTRPLEGEDLYKRPSRKVEWISAVLPVIVLLTVSEVGVLLLSGPIWAELYIDEPEDPLVVEVVGKQFEWLTRYPGKDGLFGRTDPELVHDQRNPLGLDEDDPKATDDIIKRGTLHLPVDRDVVIRLRTQDVLHSFFVPQFRVKQDLISGFTTRIQFRPTKTGKFEIACAELCGLGHFRMRGYTFVKEPQEFEEWLAGQVGWYEDE